MTVENMKTGFVERIGGTIFVVNAMPAEAMALQEADVA